MIMWPVGSLIVVGGILILLLNDAPNDAPNDEGYHDGVLEALTLVLAIEQVHSDTWPYSHECRFVCSADNGSIEAPVSPSPAMGSVKAM